MEDMNTTNVELQNQEGQQEEVKTYTQEEVNELLQREADRRVSSALSKQKAKYEKELSLSKLDEQARGVAEKDMRIQELENQLKEYTLLQNKNEVLSYGLHRTVLDSCPAVPLQEIITNRISLCKCLMTIRQFPCDLFPGQTLLCHENHEVIEIIRNLVGQFFLAGIFRRDEDLGGFLPAFLQDLIDPLFKQIIGIRAFLRMLLSVRDGLIDLV